MKTFLRLIAPLLALVAVIGFFTFAELLVDYREASAAGNNETAFGEFAWRFFTASASEGGTNFLQPITLQNAWLQTVTVAVAALGMTLIIIAGGIDLSVGSALALSAVVLAVVLDQKGFGFASGLPEAYQLSAVAAMGTIACIATGALCGLFNGLVISRLKLAPFIVTLGTMSIYLGLAKWPNSGSQVQPDRLTEIPSWLSDWLMATSLRPGYFTFPPAAWLLIGLAIVLAIVLHYTTFGRYVFAIGSNEATARLCGLHVPRLKIGIYTLAGVFTGIAGILAFARIKQARPTEGIGMELDIIAAVVIGGGSLNGGRGSVLGTIVGAMIVTFIRIGCTTLRFDDWFQHVVLGAIIIAAVSLDQWRHGREGNAG